MATPSILADCKGDIKMAEFSGREEDWGSWLTKAHAFFTLMEWDELSDALEQIPDTRDVGNAPLGVNAVPVSKALHAVLTMKLQRKALAIITLAGKGEGFQAWRMLRVEYEPSVSNRFAAMLFATAKPTLGDW